jgi:hypothetical protein
VNEFDSHFVVDRLFIYYIFYNILLERKYNIRLRSLTAAVIMRGADKRFVVLFRMIFFEKAEQKSIKTQNSLTRLQVQIPF